MMMMLERVLKVQNATVWPNHPADVLLEDVFVEHLQYFNHDSGFNEMTSVLMDLHDGSKLQVDFNDDYEFGKIHKLDLGIWVKKLSIIKMNTDDIIWVKYKVEQLDVIEKINVNGKKINFVKV